MTLHTYIEEEMKKFSEMQGRFAMGSLISKILEREIELRKRLIREIQIHEDDLFQKG